MATGEVVDLIKLDKAKQAPDHVKVWPPEDERPWTTADDKLLRMLVAKHSTRNDVPWGTISLKGNFGHNSGSCKKRYEQLLSLKHPDASVFVCANGGVTAKTMEWD